MLFKWVEGPTVSPHMVLLDMFWCSWILVDLDSNSVHDSIKQISWSDLVKLFHFLSPSLSSPVFLMILMIPKNWWKWTSLLWILSGAAMSVRITCNTKDIGAEKLQKRSLCLFTRGKQKVYIYLRPIAITSQPQLQGLLQKFLPCSVSFSASACAWHKPLNRMFSQGSSSTLPSSKTLLSWWCRNFSLGDGRMRSCL